MYVACPGSVIKDRGILGVITNRSESRVGITNQVYTNLKETELPSYLIVLESVRLSLLSTPTELADGLGLRVALLLISVGCWQKHLARLAPKIWFLRSDHITAFAATRKVQDGNV